VLPVTELRTLRFQGCACGGRFVRRSSASASTTTRPPRALITSSPLAQANSKREVVMTCSRRPVAGFTFSLSLVWLDLWKTWPAGPCVWRAVFMPSSLFFLPIGVFTNAYEEFAKARKE
jgi:hypothetical protein